MFHVASGTGEVDEFRPVSVWATILDDWRRHGRSVTDAGFVSLAIYRYGHWAVSLSSPVLRWLATKPYWVMQLLILSITKVNIPPGTQIGKEFHIIHAEGPIALHPDVVIGDRCGIMHNVTIGTNMGPGAPVIGDDVFIGVNATILGRVRVGNRVRIGANTAVSTNVPDDHIAVGSPAKIYPRLPLRAAPKADRE